jgi:ketosteroid isomerase-like protein
MVHEENTAVVRGFFAALDDQDLETVGDLLASDYRLHFDGNPEMDRRSPTSATRCRTNSAKGTGWPHESWCAARTRTR